ncbi:L-threonine dehydratase biosynthetic IlvA, partial [Listeria monocytogenes]|nr:L-threonine dehydratase biosynthetic IlvA [Listeria monocytogenes]
SFYITVYYPVIVTVYFKIWFKIFCLRI